MENNKPEDRIKAWQEKSAEVLLIRTERQADEEDYYIAGCELVWNTYVVPLQEKANLFDACKAEALRYSDMIVKLQDREEILNGAYGNALQRIQEIESKLKESEHLKELADDAIVTFQKENKALREEIERLKAEHKGIAPRMVRCSSTGCTWPNCDCSKL